MSDLVRRLLDEYRARFVAGDRPDVSEYLERAGDESGELAGLLDEFLRAAPAPDPLPETVAAMRAIAAGEPALLAQRAARGVRREAVVSALMKRFGVPAEGRPKLEQRYHELESNLLDVSRVDERVFAVIAQALGVARAQLAFGRPPQVAAETYLRMPPSAGGTAAAPAVGAAAGATPPGKPGAPSREPDDIDRLFGVVP